MTYISPATPGNGTSQKGCRGASAPAGDARSRTLTPVGQEPPQDHSRDRLNPASHTERQDTNFWFPKIYFFKLIFNIL